MRNLIHENVNALSNKMTEMTRRHLMSIVDYLVLVLYSRDVLSNIWVIFLLFCKLHMISDYITTLQLILS